ncbi:hypothetical protein H7170_00205 [Candidatus Gracilibacteria bacterium]|nr:hypothetical protein [Candidatus Gracilibacteria bacterium]
MQKITLPLVMIASLATLVSCGTSTTNNTTKTPPTPPIVTGVVETTPVIQTGTITATMTMTPNTPVSLTRDETVAYNTPAGRDLIGLHVVVTDGLITSVVATPQAEHDISKNYQIAFASDIKTKAIGKKAKDLHLDAVGGASLTTAAFEQFVRSF